ncbi:uncharacterized protein LOC134104176 [Pungitius pungitius]|uniref:uncharacterized protein LOC134104176 n=1 Tax=Pungitius pungitius TaxID=134920 RepID=UPI002E0DAD0F
MEYGRNNRRPHGPQYNQDQARQQSGPVRAASESGALFQQLQECREELRHQKGLKRMFIKREKDTREKLERLKRASDPETMITFGIASKVRSTLKTKKKKELQMEYENMKMSYVILEQKLSAELQFERDKNEALLDELEQLKLQLKTNQIQEEDVKLEFRAMKHELTFSSNQEDVTKLHAEEEEVSQALRTELKEDHEDNISEGGSTP